MIIFGLITFLILIVVFILIHHKFKHNGNSYSVEDFQDAIYNLVKSHEGIIVMISIIIITLIGVTAFRSMK